MHKGYLQTAALLGALAVALGAFGAHALKAVLGEPELQTFETGVRYQFYHSVALFITGIAYQYLPLRRFKLISIFFIAGIILFSGSLYLITALKARESVGIGGFGILTPIGGVCFIIGWVLLALSFLQKK